MVAHTLRTLGRSLSIATAAVFLAASLAGAAPHSPGNGSSKGGRTTSGNPHTGTTNTVGTSHTSTTNAGTKKVPTTHPKGRPAHPGSRRTIHGVAVSGSLLTGSLTVKTALGTVIVTVTASTVVHLSAQGTAQALMSRFMHGQVPVTVIATKPWKKAAGVPRAVVARTIVITLHQG